MAIATTTALILAGGAIASAGGAAYSAKQGANASRRATDAQTRANDEALAFERERVTKDDQRIDAREAAYQRDLAEWKARRGYGGGAAGANGKGGPSPSMPAPQRFGTALGTPSQSGPRQALTLRDLASGGGVPGGGAFAPLGTTQAPGSDVSSMPVNGPRTLRDTAEWNDWGPYLQGQG